MARVGFSSAPGISETEADGKITTHAAIAAAHHPKVVASSGTYTGDGTANRAIPHGLGVTPKAVLIIDITEYSFFEIFESAFIYKVSATNVDEHAVTIPDTTNFYVGNAASYTNSANSSTGPKYYRWVAIG